MGISSQDYYLNFDNQSIPLTQIDSKKCKDKLIDHLKCFSTIEGGLGSGVYGTSHLEYMVDHGYLHARDVWVIANRFFSAFETVFLNDHEKYLLSYAIWLHDIGMSATLAPINEELRKFIANTTEVQEITIDEIRSDLRKHHSLISEYYIKNPAIALYFNQNNCLLEKITNINKKYRDLIGLICRYHQSNWPINNKRNPFSLSKKVSNTYVLDSGVKINILLLAAFLELIDECDQLTSRIRDRSTRETENQRKISDCYNKIHASIGKYQKLAGKFEPCKDLYLKSESESIKVIEEFEQLLGRNEEIEKEIKTEWENLKKIGQATHDHYVSKQFVDIYFKKERRSKKDDQESLVLIIITDCSHTDVVFKEFKKKVKNCYNILKKFDSRIPQNLDFCIYKPNSEDYENIREINQQPEQIKPQTVQKKKNTSRKCEISQNDNGHSSIPEYENTYTIGELKYPCTIYCSKKHDQNPFTYPNIECTIVESTLKIPREILEMKDGLIEKFRHSELTNLFNGSTMRFEKWSRQPGRGNPEIMKLALSKSKYYCSLITNYVIDEPILKAEDGGPISIRNKYRINPDKIGILGNLIGFTMNLITSDNYIIITKRGENVALYPNLFNTAVSGTFDPEVDLNEDKKPCIFHSIARETKDEIGIKIKLEDIQVYSLILEYEYCKPEIIGEIRLKCSKKDLIEFERSPDERWEYDSLQFIKFEPQKIYEILKNENWIPQAAICIIDSLNREYGREGVKRALSGVL